MDIIDIALAKKLAGGGGSGGGSSLPEITSGDEGKVLTVDSNLSPSWQAASGGSNDIYMLMDLTGANRYDLYKLVNGAPVLATYRDIYNKMFLCFVDALIATAVCADAGEGAYMFQAGGATLLGTTGVVYSISATGNDLDAEVTNVTISTATFTVTLQN